MKTKIYSLKNLKGALKTTSNVAFAIILCSIGLKSNAQESYYLSSAVTVGCNGANAIMDLTKKTEIAITVPEGGCR